MSIAIKLSKSLKNAERQRLFGWGENIFGDADFQLNWRKKDLHFLLYVDEKLVSHVGILLHIISTDCQTLNIGGVGGVVTVVEEQRKGYGALLMKHAGNFLIHTREVDFGLLFCLPRMISFYNSLGWKLTKQHILIEQPTGKIPSPLPVMVLPCSMQSWPDIEIDLQS